MAGRWRAFLLLGLAFLLRPGAARAGDFLLTPAQPTLDRWNYPFNFQPADRPVAPTYGSFDSRFDTRDAEFLLGWDTASVVPTNAGPSRYLLRSVVITLSSVAPVAPTKPFVYDPTYDSYRTYLKDGADAVADSDPGRPIELYGVAFRGGFTTESFHEDSNFGPLGAFTAATISIGTRNAYGAMFDTNGVLVDVGNNVGQVNAGWTNAPFEAQPWAIGTTTNVAPGGEMPDGGTMNFAVDLSNPLVVGYLQQALDQGRLRFMVSSLSPAGQSTPGGTGFGGAGAYPWWANKENLLYDAPKLRLEGTFVSADDTDADGLPDDWERFYFGDLGAAANEDPDGDGATNAQEFLAGTDPRRNDSVLRVATWERDPTGGLVLTFPVAPSRHYVVEGSSDLLHWSELTGRLTYPTPTAARWLEEAVAASGNDPGRFVRVSVRWIPMDAVDGQTFPPLQAGTLYLVATPIGNLEDITLRAIRVLKECDVVAAEDTRRTGLLLRHFGIEKPLISYFRFNEARRSEEIVERLHRGERVALVSDAGTPGISDPGERVVRAALVAGRRVEPVPGPCALVAGITASGLPTAEFHFAGFLPHKSGQRRKELERLRAVPGTLVLYESPFRIERLLGELSELVPDRPVVVIRELTKRFEEHRRGTASELLAASKGKVWKGEFTVVVGPAPEAREEVADPEPEARVGDEEGS